MKLAEIRVENFKALQSVHLTDIGDFLLIAGPNGSGKSCILDALRILKSYYGGYSPNEIDLLYGEFQLEANNPRKLRPLFRDPAKPVIIEATFTLDAAEKNYLRTQADNVLSDYVWRQRIGRQYGDNTAIYQQRLLMAAQSPAMATEVDEQVKSLRPAFDAILSAETWRTSLSIVYGRAPVINANFLFSVIFSTFAPTHLGVIDYHSANRTYSREVVASVSGDIAVGATMKGDQSLYNTAAKYQGVKQEIVNAYIRELVRADSDFGAGEGAPASIDDSLKELFEMFFPDKVYEGVRVSREGVPEFPVRLANGHTHDLNELSSGEKEVLYGYLRLRSATPRNSIIMIDEPELHLNPALLRNLPTFYNTHIGVARNNQLILVTHSDALLRPVVGNELYQVVHLTPASAVLVGENQASVVQGADQLEKAVLALIGDVATYAPAGKFLLLEGGGGADLNELGFDRSMITALFPVFSRRVNIISGRDKSRVGGLLDVLANPEVSSTLRAKFYAVVDHDSFHERGITGVPAANYLEWSVYHIENFLLDDEVIADVTNGLRLDHEPATQIAEELSEAASQLIDELAFRALRIEVNREIGGAIDLGNKAGQEQPAISLARRIEGSARRIKAITASLSEEVLLRRLEDKRREYATAVQDGTWRKTFPGRDVLRRFTEGKFDGKVSYEYLRNSIISRMATDGLQPEEMTRVLKQIDPESF